MDKGRKSEFLSPEVLEENIAIGKPAESAGGLSAVTVALKMSVAQMGVG